MQRKTLLPILGILLLAVPVLVKATNAVNDIILVEKETVINDNFVRVGKDITIHGAVHGDVMVAGSIITIDGPVDGDVIAVGDTVTINGTVGGNIRVAAMTVSLDGTVGRNASIAAQTIAVGSDATIGWSTQTAAESLNLQGTVNGNAHFYGSDVTVAGTIHGNALFSVGENGAITIAGPAVIGKDLTYQSDQQAVIAKTATINGTVAHQDPIFHERELRNFFFSLGLLGRLVSIFGLLVLGLVLVSIAPKSIQRVVDTMRTRAKSSFGLGVLSLIAVPAVAIVLMITVIGLPLAMIALLLFGIVLYSTKIIVGIFLGQWLIGRLRGTAVQRVTLWVMIAGVVLYTLLTWIPILGWMIQIFATCFALGALILYKRERLLAEEKQAS